jgi:hypothetical protein
MILPPLAAGLAKTLLLVQLSGCPMAPPPKVTVNIHTERPRYDESLSISGLTQRFGNATAYNNFSFTDMKIGGLTDARLGSNFKISPSIIREGDYACLGVKEVVVDIYYGAIVYIPSEFPRGGCHYNVTIEHEHGHVTTALDTIREFAAKYEPAIKEAVEGMGPQGPHIDDRTVLDDQVASIESQIEVTVQAIFAELMETNQQRQYAIDDPKVLAETWKRCP